MSMFSVPGGMFNPGSAAPNVGAGGGAAPKAPFAMSEANFSHDQRLTGSSDPYGGGAGYTPSPADALASNQNNFLVSKGLITPKHATAGFYSPTTSQIDPTGYNPSIPHAYNDPSLPAQHFSQSLGIHPDADTLRAQDADKAAAQARNPTAPVADYGSANYRERLNSSYATTGAGLLNQNQALQPPSPDVVGAARNTLGTLDQADALTRKSMALSNPLASVYQQRINSGQGEIPGTGVDPSIALKNMQGQRVTDNATLAADQAQRAPYQAIVQSDSAAGRLDSANQIAANNDSLERMDKREFVPQQPRTPAEAAELAQRRESFAQQQDAKGDAARQAIATRTGQQNDRAAAVNANIANRGVDPRTLKTLSDAQVHQHLADVQQEIAARRDTTAETVAKTRADGQVAAAQARGGPKGKVRGIGALKPPAQTTTPPPKQIEGYVKQGAEDNGDGTISMHGATYQWDGAQWQKKG